MNVVLLGKGDLAIRIGDWFLKNAHLGYTLKCVVPVTPEPTWTGSLSMWAEEEGIPVVWTGHYNSIVDGPIDIGISVFYDKIIKPSFINKCRRLLNIHNSPLPLYRGVSPINWALKDERTEHGVTLHEITPGIDDGPIISQLKYSIYPDVEEVEDVYQRAINYGFTLFEQTMPILDKISPREQDESEVIYHPSSEDHLLGDRRYFNRKVQEGSR